MNKPTVGRQVHYIPHSFERLFNHTQPFAATITYVWNDGIVNLFVLREDGIPLLNKTSIALVENAQPGQCEWPKIIKEQV